MFQIQITYDNNSTNIDFPCSGKTIDEKMKAIGVLDLMNARMFVSKVDENKFDSVQEILDQRSHKQEQKHHIAMATKGKALLSGNIFCGCHLNMAGKTESYYRKDGTKISSNVIRYDYQKPLWNVLWKMV